MACSSSTDGLCSPWLGAFSTVLRCSSQTHSQTLTRSLTSTSRTSQFLASSFSNTLRFQFMITQTLISCPKLARQYRLQLAIKGKTWFSNQFGKPRCLPTYSCSASNRWILTNKDCLTSKESLIGLSYTVSQRKSKRRKWSSMQTAYSQRETTGTMTRQR